MSPADTPPIDVLVVDDSAVVRRFVSEVLNAEPDVRVAATAENGAAALDKLAERMPDVVLLDIEMPVLDGLETLARIRRAWPDLPVVMFSTLTTRGATATLDALALGATDYVSKPSHLADLAAARAAVSERLTPIIRSCAAVRRSRAALRRRAEEAAHAPVALPHAPARRIELLVLASSTGGPHALTELVPALPGGLAAPVLVVQHMPLLFTRLLAERLDARSALRVHHAEDAMVLAPGNVYVAPGGLHLRVRRAGDRYLSALDDSPPENSVKPAADVLFRSAAEAAGAAVLAVVLTGMGSDGLAGCGAIRAAGGRVLVQDEATSVIWGMPGAVARAGLAEHELALGALAPAIVSSVGEREQVPA